MGYLFNNGQVNNGKMTVPVEAILQAQGVKPEGHRLTVANLEKGTVKTHKPGEMVEYDPEGKYRSIPDRTPQASSYGETYQGGRKTQTQKNIIIDQCHC